MTTDIIELSQPLETYYCGKCGYEMTDKQYIAARFDYPCPRCNQSILSRFHPRKRALRVAVLKAVVERGIKKVGTSDTFGFDVQSSSPTL